MCYTGRLFEQEILGTCRWTNADYVPFRKAMAIVERTQPGDPTDPNSPAANDLHALVCENLGVEDYGQVALFTALGSPLDYFHGIDGFVEWMGAFVSIDLTLDSSKVEYKADVILHEHDVYTGDGSVNRQRLAEVAQDIAGILRNRARTAKRELVSV